MATKYSKTTENKTTWQFNKPSILQMKSFARFRTTLFMATALLAGVSFSACSDSENESDIDDVYGLQKNTYYDLEDTINGWDYGMYYNGKVMMVHADTARGTCMALLNEMKSESDNGVYIEIDEDGDVITFGTSQKLAYVVEKDDKTYLCADDNNGGAVFAEVEFDESTTKSTRSESKSRGFVVKNKKDILKFFLDKTTDAADDVIKKKWGTKVFGPLKKAYNNLASAINIAKMARDGKWTDAFLAVFKKGIVLKGGVSGTYATLGLDLLKYDDKETKEHMHDVFYCKANCDIINIVRRSEGAYEVTVKIENSYSIPQEHRETVVAADGTEKMVYVKNEVYCGVLARYAYEPEYQNCDTRSGEILVKRTADDQELTFVIYTDETYTLLRPFLMVDLDLTNKPNMRHNFQHIKYGESFPLITANVDYTYEIAGPCQTYSKWNEEGQMVREDDVSFPLKFKARCNALNNKHFTSVRDWGVVLRKGDEPGSFISLQNENDDQSQIGSITSESTQNFGFKRKDLDINRAMYTAKPKNYYIAPYVEFTTDFNSVEKKRVIGKFEPFEPKYIQKPAAEFTSGNYSWTFWNNLYAEFVDDEAYNSIGYARINWSVNDGYANINGTLFVDSVFLRKSGSGWDKYVLSIGGVGGERTRVPVLNLGDIVWRRDIYLIYREDSASAKPRYLTLELWSGGSCTTSKNKLVFKPIYYTGNSNYYPNVYRIEGFKLDVE